MRTISSTGNALVKSVSALVSRSSERKKQKAFVIEGVRAFREAPAERLREVFVSEAFIQKCLTEDPVLADRIGSLKCDSYSVTEDVMRKLSDTQHPQGILAVVKTDSASPDDLFPDGAVPLIIVAEHLQDPGNLGTIIRCGEGAGITGLILAGDTVDPYNPKTVRGTMGSIFRVPIVACGEINEAVNMLKERGVMVYAADARGATDYDRTDLKKGCAFIIGNEGAGLSDDALRAADGSVCIPMSGSLESLNAAVCAAVLMYEAARQRRNV
ncbi:MAG: RNA methyltransferase [Lachnospiraceae bacterium]|nr:RNA methyltransferase [Lachnospiraceae bacterium]